MTNYLFRRLLGLLPTLLIVAVLIFMFLHLLPGDPARLAAGPDADTETVELVRRDLGLASRAAGVDEILRAAPRAGQDRQ